MIDTINKREIKVSGMFTPLDIEKMEIPSDKKVITVGIVGQTAGDYVDYSEIGGLSNLEVTYLLEKKMFRWGNKEYILKEPVTCIPDYIDNIWVFKCPKYNLHTFSENYNEALIQLDEEFAFLCNGLLNEDNSNLTKDAIELRDVLKKDIFEIRDIG